MDNGMINVDAYVASYSVHSDGKSHTGIIISLGAVFAKSTKQRIVTKSSTESELVAASDSFNIFEAMRNFIIEIGDAKFGKRQLRQKRRFTVVFAMCRRPEESCRNPTIMRRENDEVSMINLTLMLHVLNLGIGVDSIPECTRNYPMKDKIYSVCRLNHIAGYQSLRMPMIK
jgi:hypothetical protein